MFQELSRRCFAAAYDAINGPAERAGLRERRRSLLAQATGVTIEIGAGTGLNLPYYPAAVTRLVLVEPDPHMRRRLRAHAERLGRTTEILDARAERLPFPDSVFDTAVVTFALCRVPQEQSALAEIARVLRPGGELLFLEHVRSTDPKVAAKQDKRPFPYPLIGCHPNRATLDAIEASPLTVESVLHGEVPKVPRVESPMIVGSARRPVPTA
ncbi:class I SAM-dependent methyltransferase [Streptacidiphilus sp. N1-3]|uniref:Class I SAM-dependent methyltransferase n=1 Tax=Streptacidiphilus alkalitolerans TaxID=3342712 RepID=A0ABV6XDS1_9ACTN